MTRTAKSVEGHGALRSRFWLWLGLTVLVGGHCGPADDAQVHTAIDPLIFTQQQKIHAFDAASGDAFGAAMNLSGDGNTAIVGSWTKSSQWLSNNGAAYVYVRASGGWNLQQVLEPTDAASGDNFGGAFGGIALSMDGNTALIGAFGKSDAPLTGNGDAYVFVRSGGKWTQQQKLQPMDPASGDQFGTGVSLSGDGNTALVTAFAKSDGPLSNNGDAYIFVRANGTWTQQQKLQASDRASNDGFGAGSVLSADGNTALIGAFTKSTFDFWAGQAYIFTRNGSTWTEHQRLQSLDLARRDQFGSGVALSADGSIALIGALGKTNDPFTVSGDAYIFLRINGTYIQQQKLQASDRGSNDFFGNYCALSADGSIGLVGAPAKSDSGLTGNGAAYLFVRDSGGYTQEQKLQAADQGPDAFAAPVAMSADGQTVLCGSEHHSDSPLSDNGDVYVFQSSGQACAAPSDCLSGYCVDGVCCNTACGGGVSSDCQACSVAAGAAVNGVCSLLPATVACHSPEGACDLPAACTGISPACPSDTTAPQSQICRPSTGPRDPAEFCDGATKTCPADVNDSFGCSIGARGAHPSATGLLLGLFLIPLLRRSRRIFTQRRILLATWGLLGLALSQCSNEPLVVLDIDPSTIPAGASAMQVLTVTNGVPAPLAHIDGVKQRIAIYLPGQSGTTNLEVDALDSSGCKLAAAEVAYSVPDGISRAIEGFLALHDFHAPVCTLTLTLTGVGAVTSSPAGITCTQAGACSADFPSGESVTLYPARSNIPSWIGCDSALGSACVVTVARRRQVAVLF